MRKNILILVMIFACGCSQKSRINSVYKNSSYVIDLCKGKSLMKSRGENFIEFDTYKDTMRNQYFIDIDSLGNYSLYRDMIQYRPDILGIDKEIDSGKYRQVVCQKVKVLNHKLDSLGIREFRTDFALLGVGLKIYMKSGSVMVYLIDSVDKEYKASLKEIGNNWYYEKG